MPDESDMAVPVTRGEMNAALEKWATEIVQTLQKVLREDREEQSRELKGLRDEQSKELEGLRDEQSKELKGLRDELREEVGTSFGVLEEHMREEVRFQAQRTEENVITRVQQMLDPYKQVPEHIAELARHELSRRVDELDEARLPERVGKLESKVFAPKRRATAARRKRS